MMPFGFRKTEYANPGAMNYAYIPNTTLPAFAVGGAGNLAYGSIDVIQPRQAITQITVPTNGYGGLNAGQFIQQPLMG